jgi:hypothetical protein
LVLSKYRNSLVIIARSSTRFDHYLAASLSSKVVADIVRNHPHISWAASTFRWKGKRNPHANEFGRADLFPSAQSNQLQKRVATLDLR